MLKRIFTGLLKRLFSLPENFSTEIKEHASVLIVRQHNQFGDMLASVSLFRAFKETYPGIKVNVLASPQNFYAVTSNSYIDELFVFDKTKLVRPSYLKQLKSFLRKDYDIVVVPATVSVSFTSNLISRIAKGKTRIGPASLDGIENDSSYLFDRRVVLDWRHTPDCHVSDFCLDIVRKYGITTKDFTSHISWDVKDEVYAENLISSIKNNEDKKIIGLHIGAGKPPNRWPLDNFIELIELLYKTYNAKFIITGSTSDFEEIEYMKKNCKHNIFYVINQPIPRLAAVINKCNLFITNDTGVMHVAGVTDTRQISIFGPTNPYNWAPLGDNKIFIKKSEIISEISVNEVMIKAEELLAKEN